MKTPTAVIRTALLALAGAALFAQSAHAQTITVNNGDLVLGVEGDSSQTGTGTDYEVDLGNISQLSLTGTTDFGNIVSAADISGQFGGPSALSSNDLFWSVIGSNPKSLYGAPDLSLSSKLEVSAPYSKVRFWLLTSKPRPWRLKPTPFWGAYKVRWGV